jgi:hypothetical protein
VTLLLKLLLAPALVVGSSLAGRRWGAQVTGMLVALPIVAGPILLIICLDQGTGFGAQAATSSLLGLVSLSLFVVVFAWCSRSRGWVVSLLVSWGACLAAGFGLAQLVVPPVWGLVVALAASATAARILAGLDRADAPPTGAGEETRPWWDLPGRAVATAVLVLVVTGASGALGPNLTGVLAPFPIATSVVAAFALAQQGSAGAVLTLRGFLRGLFGFSAFCFLVAVLVEPLGVAAAFGIGLLGAVAVQLVWRVLAPV